MRKKVILALSAMAISAAVMTGCDTSASTAESGNTNTSQAEESSADAETADAKTDTNQLANPWTDTDQEGLASATGFEMTAPDGATDVSYSYMSESGLAQMTFKLDDTDWVYRMQMADELTDISGISIEWDSEEKGIVSDREAIYYSSCDMNDEEREDHQLVNWYDAVTGVTYSLSATGTDLNGLDIEAYAENIYSPLQGEATDD
jgi:hypothetical protein